MTGRDHGPLDTAGPNGLPLFFTFAINEWPYQKGATMHDEYTEILFHTTPLPTGTRVAPHEPSFLFVSFV